MPTPRKSAPFDLEPTRGPSQLSHQPVFGLKVIRRIAELELELLNVVHEHYGVDLPSVRPVFFLIQHDTAR